MTGAVRRVLSGRWTWKANSRSGSAATHAALRQAMAT